MTNLHTHRLFQIMAGAVVSLSLAAAAQAPAPAPEPAKAPADAPATVATPEAAPAAAPAPPVWSVGTIDFSGFVDGYYSYNFNRPSEFNAADSGQTNQLYNFNDTTDQFSLSAAKLTINHDPDPVGAHVDFFYGNTNRLVNASPSGGRDGADYIEQAFLSFKPAKAHGMEIDLGKFVTSAGAEVIESKDNWNYSRGLLFVNAIPYFHFGLRSSLPVTKVWTAGVQLVNGWNNTISSNGGVTVGLTSGLVEPKYTWNVNYYVGPENNDTQKGYTNLIDTTILTTFTGKLNFLINYDYAQSRTAVFEDEEDVKRAVVKAHDSSEVKAGPEAHWQGVAFGAKYQSKGNSALAGRFEYFSDPQGARTFLSQDVKEITGTYEYKWPEGLLARFEYRRDWSNDKYFARGDLGLVKAQSTLTAGFVAFFGPKR